MGIEKLSIIAAYLCLATAQASAKSSTLIKALYSPPLTYDPIVLKDTASEVVINQIYSGLLKFDENLQIEGDLAEIWRTSADGLHIYFKLRPNLKFEDGSPLTVTDVLFSFKRLLSQESQVYTYYECISGADQFHKRLTPTVSGFRIISVNEFEISLATPFPPFLSILAGATAKILPGKLIQNQGRAFFNHPVGSGPFNYISTRKNKDASTDIVLKANPLFYGGIPSVETFILRALDEGQALTQAQEGLIDDLSNYPLTGKEEIFKTGKRFEAPVAATWIIGLNTKIAPFNSRETRQHFKNSINSEEFRKTFYPDAIPAFGYIPPGIPGYRDQGNKPSESANTKTKITIFIPKELSNNSEIKNYLELSLHQRGWNVTITPINWSGMMAGYTKKALQAYLISMNMDYPDAEFLVRNFESSNPDNFSSLKNSKLDSLIRKARMTQDRVLRTDLYKEISEVLEVEAVTVNLFHPRAHYWVSKCVEGFKPNILADYYIDYSKVTKIPECEGNHQ